MCAAGLANLAIIEDEKLVQKAREQGRYLQKALATLKDIPIVGDVRGKGLVAAIELVKDKHTKEMFPAETKLVTRVWERALRSGLLTRMGGSNVIAICPPLIITTQQIDEMVTILRETLVSVSEELGEDWKLASGK